MQCKDIWQRGESSKLRQTWCQMLDLLTISGKPSQKAYPKPQSLIRKMGSQAWARHLNTSYLFGGSGSKIPNSRSAQAIEQYPLPQSPNKI